MLIEEETKQKGFLICFLPDRKQPHSLQYILYKEVSYFDGHLAGHAHLPAQAFSSSQSIHERHKFELVIGYGFPIHLYTLNPVSVSHVPGITVRMW